VAVETNPDPRAVKVRGGSGERFSVLHRIHTEVQARRTGRPHLQGIPMGWLGAIAAGLAVRGAMRRRQRRDAAIEVARLQDIVDGLTVDDRAEYTVWPPEAVDGR
jgi:hypothetical protein